MKYNFKCVFNNKKSKKSVALTTEKWVESVTSQNENNFAVWCVVGAFCLRQLPGDGEFSSHNID